MVDCLIDPNKIKYSRSLRERITACILSINQVEPMQGGSYRGASAESHARKWTCREGREIVLRPRHSQLRFFILSSYWNKM